MRYPVVKDLPPYSPPLSIIIPYDEGLPFNELHACRNDEVLVVLNGNSIGEKRIAGAMKARNEWLVMLDADGNYPRDFIPRVKEAISRLGFPLMMAVRTNLPIARLLESGMVVRKDYFLKKTLRYPCGKWRNPRIRTDVYECFKHEPYAVIDAFYSHPLSTDEKRVLNALLSSVSMFRTAVSMADLLRTI